jgi:hypothetical protein
MSDIRDAIMQRYMDGWRPSPKHAGMWARAVWDLPPDTPAPDFDDPDFDDPDEEPMTDAEVAFLADHT